MENTAKVTAKKTTKNTKANADFNESVSKVKATAKEVNAQIAETATDIAEDIKEIGQELQKVATETVKKVTKKADLSKSVKKAKTTATKVNKEIMETANEIAEEVMEKGKELKDATTKIAKDAINNFDLTDRLNAVKKAAVKANEYALETTEELIDSVAVNGEKWQNVTEKAIKNGLKLAERQQTIMFTTLEAVKTQLDGSATRLKKLFRK